MVAINEMCPKMERNKQRAATLKLFERSLSSFSVSLHIVGSLIRLFFPPVLLLVSIANISLAEVTLQMLPSADAKTRDVCIVGLAETEIEALRLLPTAQIAKIVWFLIVWFFVPHFVRSILPDENRRLK